MDWSLPPALTQRARSAAQSAPDPAAWPKTVGLSLPPVQSDGDQPGLQVLALQGGDGATRWARLNEQNRLEVQTDHDGDFRSATAADSAALKDSLREYVQRNQNPVVADLRQHRVDVDPSRPFAEQPAIRGAARYELEARAQLGQARGWKPRPPITEADITRRCESFESSSKQWDATLGAFLRS